MEVAVKLTPTNSMLTLYSRSKANHKKSPEGKPKKEASAKKMAGFLQKVSKELATIQNQLDHDNSCLEVTLKDIGEIERKLIPTLDKSSAEILDAQLERPSKEYEKFVKTYQSHQKELDKLLVSLSKLNVPTTRQGEFQIVGANLSGMKQKLNAFYNLLLPCGQRLQAVDSKLVQFTGEKRTGKLMKKQEASNNDLEALLESFKQADLLKLPKQPKETCDNLQELKRHATLTLGLIEAALTYTVSNTVLSASTSTSVAVTSSLPTPVFTNMVTTNPINDKEEHKAPTIS